MNTVTNSNVNFKIDKKPSPNQKGSVFVYG